MARMGPGVVCTWQFQWCRCQVQLANAGIHITINYYIYNFLFADAQYKWQIHALLRNFIYFVILYIYIIAIW